MSIYRRHLHQLWPIVLYVHHKCTVNLLLSKGFKDFIVGLLKPPSKHFYCFISEKMQRLFKNTLIIISHRYATLTSRDDINALSLVITTTNAICGTNHSRQIRTSRRMRISHQMNTSRLIRNLDWTRISRHSKLKSRKTPDFYNRQASVSSTRLVILANFIRIWLKRIKSGRVFYTTEL